MKQNSPTIHPRAPGNPSDARTTARTARADWKKITRRESKEKNATRRDHAPVLARLGTFTTPSASSASASTSSSRGSSLTTASPPPPFSPPVSLPSSLDRAIDFLCSFVRASRSDAHVETNRNATRTRMEWKIQREIDRASFAPLIHPSIHPSSRFGGSSVRPIAFRLVSPRPLKLVVVLVAKTSRHRRRRRLATVTAVTASRTNAVARRAAPRNSQQSTPVLHRDATLRERTKQLYRKKINDEHDARETRAHAPHRANPSPPSSDARARARHDTRAVSESLPPSLGPSLVTRSVPRVVKVPTAVSHSRLFTHTRVFHKISRESVDSHRKWPNPRIRSRRRHHSTYVYVLRLPIRTERNRVRFFRKYY